MPIGLPELLILFVAALLIFGPKKLPEMGSAIGKSITAFRKGWQEVSNDVTEDMEILERRAELKRLEIEALDREIAAKRAMLLTASATGEESNATLSSGEQATETEIAETPQPETSPAALNTEEAATEHTVSAADTVEQEKGQAETPVQGAQQASSAR